MTSFFVAAHAWIEKDGAFLVTRRSAANDYMPGTWDVPGGTIEAGERVEGSLPERQVTQIVYRCRYVSGDVALTPEEHDEHRWVSAAEARTLHAIAFLEAFLSTLDRKANPV